MRNFFGKIFDLPFYLVMRFLEGGSARPCPDLLGELAPAPQPAPTGFEKRLMACFKDYHGNPGYRAMFVSIIASDHGDHKYEDPLTGFTERATFNVGAVPTYFSIEEAIRRERNVGHRPVMLIDLHGKKLAEQLIGWQPGTIAFPDMFLAHPLISVPDPGRRLCVAPGLVGIGIEGEEPQPSRPAHARPVPAKQAQAQAQPLPFRQASSAHAFVAQPVVQDVPDALPDCFHRAFAKRRDGATYFVPEDIIRGVLNNDMP